MAQRVTSAMLDAGASGAAARVLEKFGEVSVFAVLDWANHLDPAVQPEAPAEVPAGWRQAPKRSSGAILGWLSRHRTT